MSGEKKRKKTIFPSESSPDIYTIIYVVYIRIQSSSSIPTDLSTISFKIGEIYVVYKRCATDFECLILLDVSDGIHIPSLFYRVIQGVRLSTSARKITSSWDWCHGEKAAQGKTSRGCIPKFLVSFETSTSLTRFGDLTKCVFIYDFSGRKMVPAHHCWIKKMFSKDVASNWVKLQVTDTNVVIT